MQITKQTRMLLVGNTANATRAYYVSRAIELLKELKDKIQHCNKII